MRRLPISHLRPGMVVAWPVYSSSGQLLVNKGVRLTAGIIERLVQLGIPALYIADGYTDDLAVEDVISEQTRLKAIQQVRELLTEEDHGAHSLGRVFYKVERLARTVNEIIEELLAKRHVVVNLTDIRAVDDYTFGHSVNVCVLSLLTGLTLSYNRAELFHLGLGAIMHDLGKVRVPKEILQKPGPLTGEEFALMKRHAEWGHEMLRAVADVSRLAALIPLQHHERYAGQGYPAGLKGKDIHDFAAICGLANVFDAITADRVYRRAAPVHEAYEYLAGSGNYLFDYRLLCAFLENIALYPTGTMVRLSTGEVAVVVETRRGMPRRPKVRVLCDAAGRPLDPFELDLAAQTNVVITEVLGEDKAPPLPSGEGDTPEESAPARGRR